MKNQQIKNFIFIRLIRELFDERDGLIMQKKTARMFSLCLSGFILASTLIPTAAFADGEEPPTEPPAVTEEPVEAPVTPPESGNEAAPTEPLPPPVEETTPPSEPPTPAPEESPEPTPTPQPEKPEPTPSPTPQPTPTLPQSNIVDPNNPGEEPDLSEEPKIPGAEVVVGLPADYSEVDITNLFRYKIINLAELVQLEIGTSENPFNSGNVKYNTWLYGSPVYNEKNQFNHYRDSHDWSATFISWLCKDLSIARYKSIPATADSNELFNWFADNAAAYTLAELESDSYIPQVNDFIFIKTIKGYRAGLLIEATPYEVSFVCGDLNNSVVQLTYKTESLADDTVFYRLDTANDYLYSYIDYLVDELGITPAAAVGILANIQHESGYNPHAYGDYGTSYGLCQWHNERWVNLVDFCEAHDLDSTTASGQMAFLVAELQIEKYTDLLARLRNYPDTAQGSYDAAFDFCSTFELPADTEKVADMRGDIAIQTLYPALIG